MTSMVVAGLQASGAPQHAIDVQKAVGVAGLRQTYLNCMDDRGYTSTQAEEIQQLYKP
jgi:hypothetical protein